MVSFVYGLNTYTERRNLWTDLVTLSSNMCWCLLGDFNVIKDLQETNQPNASWDVGKEEFKDCTTSIGMDDIRATGPVFIWWNNQPAHPVHKKLDRALGNSEWFSKFDLSQVAFAHCGLFDHSLVLLNTGIQFSKPRRQFQYFNHMSILDGFHEAVRLAWDTHFYGNPFYVFSEKLKCTKKALSSLNISMGNLTTLVKIARDDLHLVQTP